MNIQKMMQQAQQMQERMQKQMAETVIEASAGGVVNVKVNGAKQVLAITIDPEAVNKEDVEMLQDAILAAIQDAQRKADDKMNSTMSGMLGGMKLPGM
jgi:DNA-binding YbaB/EbfC family protein